MNRFITLSTLVVLVACLEGAKATESLRCENEVPMSFKDFDEYCNELTGHSQDGFNRMSDTLEDHVKRIKKCSCFFVDSDRHALWYTLLKPEHEDIFEAALDHLRFYKTTPTTDIKLLKSSTYAYSKYLGAYTTLREDITKKLPKHLKNNNGEKAYEACVDLRKVFGLFKKYILKLGEMTGNANYPYVVSGQEENLAKLMIVSDVCFGAYKVDMTEVGNEDAITHLKPT